MYDQRMENMEKNLETSIRMFPLPNNQFNECQESLIMVMENWDKHRAKLVQLGEKLIQLDIQQEDRLTQMTTHLQQELGF
jgi:hypothetical protein